MTNARTALIQAAERFAFSPTARLDAELLLAHALGIERNALLLDLTRPVPDSFWPLVERRAASTSVSLSTRGTSAPGPTIRSSVQKPRVPVI